MHVFLRSTNFDKKRVSQGPTVPITKVNSLKKISLAYTNKPWSFLQKIKSWKLPFIFIALLFLVNVSFSFWIQISNCSILKSCKVFNSSILSVLRSSKSVSACICTWVRSRKNPLWSEFQFTRQDHLDSSVAPSYDCTTIRWNFRPSSRQGCWNFRAGMWLVERCKRGQNFVIRSCDGLTNFGYSWTFPFTCMIK